MTCRHVRAGCRKLAAAGRTGLAALLLCLPALAMAEVAAGLIRNSSGLPATFPLQVKTDAGLDYRLTLRDPDTGAERLTAHIGGGRFFRVLVPPGRFTLHFDYGRQWQDETARFGNGPDAGGFDLPEPLTFEIRGSGVRAGHIVDLRGLQRERPAVISGQFICQGLRYEYDPAFDRRPGPIDRAAPDRLPEDLWFRSRRIEVRSRYCR